MKHKRMTEAAATPEALEELLGHGTMADWGPLLATVRADPDGAVADRILTQLEERDYGQTAAFWRGLITQARADRDRSSVPRRQG